MKKAHVWTIIIVATLVVVCVGGLIAQSVSDHNYINEWALDNNKTIQSIERPIFGGGPFFFNSKYNRVYKVTTDTSVVWFRFGNLIGGVEVETDSGDF